MKIKKLPLIFLVTLPLFTACGANQGADTRNDQGLLNVGNRGNTTNQYADFNRGDTTEQNAGFHRSDNGIHRVNNLDQQNNTRNNNTVNHARNNQTVSEEKRMEIAEKAEESIEKLDEVRRANVIVTNKNAYVAVVLEHDTKGEIRRDLEQRISDQVKASDNKIRNVYVSTNPDFVNRMGDYGNKIQSGRPITGLFEEFTEMITRIFPNAR